jgi:acyl-CoA synthetase (NDP forming)
VLGAVRQAAEVSAAPVTVSSTLPELTAEGAIAGLRSGLRAVRPRPAGAVKRDRRGTTSGRWLDEYEAKQRLRAAGIPVPDGRVTDDAVAAWRELGGPVAVKRTRVVHKAREGGVALHLDDPIAIAAAQHRLGAPVLVERMAPPGVELLVSVKRDGFVPVLVLGLGGVWTEVLDDAVVLPLPVTAGEVEAALQRLRGAPVLTGVDTRAAAEVAVRLTHTNFVLAELNPVIVHAHGAVAVDALADEEELT